MQVGEQGYLELIRTTLDYGYLRESRVGQTYSRFAPDSLMFDLAHGFPIITTRKIHWKPVLGELRAFLEGATHVEDFQKYGCHYWTADAARWDKNGYLGRIYGAQWRNWIAADVEGGVRHVDQLRNLVDGLVKDPWGRRHIVTSWQPGELDHMALPPCHTFFQVNLRPGVKSLDMLVYMRSVDLCLGLPSDLVLYGMLLHLLAEEVKYKPGRMTFSFGDAHVYANHAEMATVQMMRTPLELPELIMQEGMGVFDFDHTAVTLPNYISHSPLVYKLNTIEVKA